MNHPGTIVVDRLRPLQVSNAQRQAQRTAVWLLMGYVFCVPVWLPLLWPTTDLLMADDAQAHMIRTYHLGFLLSEGVWWPRWVPDMFMGYGYPLFNFYAPGSYYLCWALARLFRLEVWDAYRAAYLIAIGVGLGGMFVLGRRLSQSRRLGTLAMVCFAYQPYVFLNLIYHRGDLPEVLGVSVIPWLLWAIHGLWHEPLGHPLRHPLRHPLGQAGETVLVPSMWAVVAAACAVVFCHNLTAVTAATLATLWLALLMLVRPRRSAVLGAALAGALAAGLTAPFTVPAIAETPLVHLDELSSPGWSYWRNSLVDPAGRPRDFVPDNRQTPTGLIDRNWLYPNQNLSTPKLSLAQLGLVTAIVCVLAVVAAVAVLAPPGRSPSLRFGLRFGLFVSTGMLIAAAVCWFLTLRYAAPVWEHLSILRLYQSPARLFAPISVCLTVAVVAALGLLAATAARWPGARGLLARNVLPVGVGAMVMLNGGGVLPVQSRVDAFQHIDAQWVRQNEQSWADVGTTGNREFLPQLVDVPEYTAGIPRLHDVYLRLYPEDDWLGGLLQPLGGNVSVHEWTALPLRLTARMTNEGPSTGQLGVHQLMYPGWRAWIDGVRTEIGVVERSASQQASLGFMVIPVPPGEHTVTLAFGPTKLRLMSLLTFIVAVAVTLVLALCAPAGAPRPRTAALLLGVACAGAIALVTWRTAAPALVRAATVPPLESGQVRAQGTPPLLPLLPVQIGHTPPYSASVAALADEVLAGRAQIRSPSGARLGNDTFVDVRFLTITDSADPGRGAAGVSRRRWLYLHPPSSVAWDVNLPDVPGLLLQTALAIDPAVWDAPTGDGVRFLATVTPLDPSAPNTAPQVVLDEVVNPRARAEQRRWLPVAADLSPWRGGRIRLTLATDVREDTTFDWSGWAEPVVVVRNTARRPGS